MVLNSEIECPRCQALYQIDSSRIFESRPEFSCHHCHSQFWTPFPFEGEGQSLRGYLVDQLENEGGMRPTYFCEEGKEVCPKCGFEDVFKGQECPQCQVLIGKFDPEEDPFWRPSSSLARSWKAVVEDYDSQQVHRQFLDQCFQERNLLYGCRQYRNLLNVNPTDVMAKSMLVQIELIAQSELNSNERIRFPRCAGIFAMAYLVAGGMMGLGLAFYQMKTLFPAGLGLLLLILVLRRI